MNIPEFVMATDFSVFCTSVLSQLYEMYVSSDFQLDKE
jgi:hypothetical protein